MSESQMALARGTSIETLRTTVHALLLQRRTAGPAASGLVSTGHVKMQQDSNTSSDSEIDMTVPSSLNPMDVEMMVASAPVNLPSQPSRPKRKSAQHAEWMLQHTPTGVPRKKQKVRARMYVVQRLVMKRMKEGRLEYLVQWEGYDEQTWEPISQIKHTDAYDAWLNAARHKRQRLLFPPQSPAEIAAAARKTASEADMDPFEFTG